MIDIPIERLLYLNKLGIIPGPDEKLVDFAQRAEYCLSLKSLLVDELSTKLPFKVQSEDTTLLLKEPCWKTQELFDITPWWIPVFFSNYQLAPWHGGCVWLFQMTEKSSMGAFLQLRQAFRNSQKYLGIYNRNELISHEISHVGRMLYQEPKFEEVLAYQTSDSSFRRWFGPIIQSSFESMLFVIVLLLIFILDVSLIMSGNYADFKIVQWIKLLPIVMIVLAMGRLYLRHYCFAKCLKKLTGVVGEAHKARAVTYRLLDSEISAFSRLSENQIKEYAQNNAFDSLRWQVIYSAYFHNHNL